LSLGGSAGNSSVTWLRSYARWAQALSSRDSSAVQDSLRILAAAIAEWLGADRAPQLEVLRNFWGSYLGDAMRTRGLNIEVPPELGDLSRRPQFGWRRAPVTEPVSKVTDVENLVRQPFASASKFLVSTDLTRNDKFTESVTVQSDGDHVEFHFLSETWWTEKSVQTIEGASAIAQRALSFALESFGLPAVPSEQGSS
jgi:hypothetical protein